MIIRVPHRRQFTVVANQALQDGRLSFRATGVLAYLLSLPEDVTISARKIGQVKAEGRDAVLAALLELEKAGYLQRERRQDYSGKWSTVCTLAELPPENPLPSPGKPDPENQALEIRTQVLKDVQTNTNTADAPLEIHHPLALPDVPVAKGLVQLWADVLEERRA